VLAQLLDDADAFVSQDRARLHAWERAADEVEIGPADRAGGEPDDRVGVFLDLRLLHGVEPDVADAVEHDRLHDASMSGFAVRGWRRRGGTATGARAG